MADGFPGGYAADDGCGLLFEDGVLADVVASRPGAHGHLVTARGEGLTETRLESRLLGAPASGRSPGGGYSEPPSSSDTES